MEIITHEHHKEKRLFTKDYYPNPAMINEFQTLFFTCKLRQIELAGQELQGFSVEGNAQFLVLHLTIQNKTNEILSMFKEDFLIRFDEDGPFEAEDAFGVKHQFSDMYALKPDEEVRGNLVFIIPKSCKKICFSYTEYFDEDGEGKTYKLKYQLA